MQHGTSRSQAAVATVVTSGPATAVTESWDEGDQLYVTNGALRADPNTANVARFGINAAGQVSPAGTVEAGHGARGIVFTPEPNAVGQRFAYVSSLQAGRIDRYRVASNGALTFLGATPTQQPFGIAIGTDGRTVYVANFEDGEGNGSLSAFRVETEGVLTLLNKVDSGAVHPKGVAVTPNGHFVYVSHGTPNSTEPSVITGFTIGTDGSVQGKVAEAGIGGSGHRVVITPDGRFVYVTNQESGDKPEIFGFRIDESGALTPVSDQPFESGVWTEGATISPDGRRLYVTALGVVGPPESPVQDGQIRGFAIGADGRLTETERIDFGFDPVDLAFGHDGKHLYVSDFSGHTITVFNVDAGGNLDPIQTGSSQGQNPGFQSIVVQPARSSRSTEASASPASPARPDHEDARR
jgi:6-phosphogluconolactonase